MNKIILLGLLFFMLVMSGSEPGRDVPCPDVDTMAILAKYPCYEDTRRLKISGGIMANMNDTAKVSLAPSILFTTKKNQVYVIWYDPFLRTFGASAYIPIFQPKDQ
jgi:hypothetical protein